MLNNLKFCNKINIYKEKRTIFKISYYFSSLKIRFLKTIKHFLHY